jgi:hypothetical protein
MYKYVLSVLFLFLFKLSYSQQPSIGIEAGTGVSIPLTSVLGYPSPLAYASISFAPIKLGHVSVDYNMGVLWGKGKMTSDLETSNSNLGSNTFKYKTTYTSYGVSGYLNLHHVFKSRKKAKKIIPYLHLGLANLKATSSADNLTINSNKTYSQNYFISVYGVLLKVKINHQFDWTIHANINLTETEYLDAIYYDKKYDAKIDFKVGLVYYPGANKKRNYIAWQPYKKICPRSLSF